MHKKGLRAKPLLLVEALATRNDSGLGNMARLFTDGLRRLAEKADIKVILRESGGYRPSYPCETILVRPRPIRFWTQVAFPLIIRRLAPDGVLCLGQNLPAWRPAGRYALAIPDAGPLENLGWATSSHDPYNRRWLTRMAPKADSILTISGFTKLRLISLLGIPPDRIQVVLPIRPSSMNGGLDAMSAQASQGSHPQGDYFLSLGNLEPRKNFPGLIAAYAELKHRRSDAPPLYIVGHKAWGHGEIQAAIARHGLSESVRLTDYLSDADRSAHVAHCLAYVSSSLYEGWGLPLFEALALGRPAIYHAGSSQEEFARGMALAVDCGDPGALSRAMEALWTDPGERARLAGCLREGFGKRLAYDLEGGLSAALSPLLGL
ncbi:MAG: wbpY [Fibrobacteres bacterium]|nr:wbpY [Fibrobacterota bacterium]